MSLQDNVLTVFTDQYLASGVYCPIIIEIDVQKMEDSDVPSVVTFSKIGYYSAMKKSSYRNILGIDEEEQIYGVVTEQGRLYISDGDSISNLQPDSALGDNEYDEDLIITDATNMAISSSHYLVASVFENYGINNIYLAVQEKNTGNISGYLLTNATAFNSEINVNPWIVDLGDDRFVLLWERIELGTVNVCSVLLNASGMPMGEIQTWWDCSLSMMVPRYVSDNIFWITAEEGKVELYQLSALDESGYQELDNGIVECDTIWSCG